MLVSSRKIAQSASLKGLLNDRCDLWTNNYLLRKKRLKQHREIAGWGRKASFFRAQRYAAQYGLDCICLEDGFIRSLGLGKAGYPALSLVMDRRGIYFDALQTSDLEQLIAQMQQHDAPRALSAIATIKSYGITKYNQKFEAFHAALFAGQKNILVVDQTFGDQSIHYAGARPATFQYMLQQALQDHPDAVIWVKTHPDVLAGRAQGHFQAQDLQHPRIQTLTANYNPFALLQAMDEVYVVSSQLGFEALLCEKTVHCFGVPWYAAWGLTDDQHAPLHILKGRRQQARSLAQLFDCAYLQYARYVSPITGQPCTLEQILAILIPNIQAQTTLPSALQAYGFSRWKREFIRAYLAFPQTQVRFHCFLKPKKTQQIVAWGKKAKALKAQGYSKVCTVEDGFIRSLGLGAALIRPYALVFDELGIYYDATQPSSLEQQLNQAQLDAAQLQRARALIATIKQTGISKYNVGQNKSLLRPATSQRVLLVIGQVDDDLSVQLGGVDIKTNLSLLQQVRQDHPDAYIIYKPHPDVHAGLRKGQLSDNIVLQYANCIELFASIIDCFKICDEIHTISSLTGFEALLRGVTVCCYGLPFYAGWGLTHDRHVCQRRQRQLSLEELVYITLIDYSVYNLPVADHMCIPRVGVEQVIDYLQQERLNPIARKKSWLAKLFTTMRRLRIGKLN
ncbi:capsular polysaccharide biosynthesis protein [Acinetobacter larvae]|uniref:Beta-3-deoxy-D-manno-oct-2-ulosonic acid transferase n=1 Tax=Acinetobacter larvae TaxID=1789224 RepID=A0A1B2M1Y9_9GAMM|nr:capsular polysaccharide biosynthesis protein [Acinetobacter larvae]AOA59202.1 beta-3-deoxy-D-manno-oct-2-ulosonic acid transferase [Acinetobacter larvae]